MNRVFCAILVFSVVIVIVHGTRHQRSEVPPSGYEVSGAPQVITEASTSQESQKPAATLSGQAVKKTTLPQSPSAKIDELALIKKESNKVVKTDGAQVASNTSAVPSDW